MFRRRGRRFAEKNMRQTTDRRRIPTERNTPERESAMHVIHRRGWELSESQATPERLFFDRRQFLAAAGVAGIALSSGAAQAQRVTDLSSLPDPSASLYP